MGNGYFNGGLRRIHRRNFQHGDKLCSLIVFAVQVTPSIGALCFGVAMKIKNLDIPLPDCFAPKHFTDRH